MNKLIIIGASGHGKVVADIARQNGYSDIVFLDDDGRLERCGGYPVVGHSGAAPAGEVFVAVGNAAIRKKLMDQYQERTQPVLLYASAVVAADVEIGKGTVVMAGAVINPGARIGQGVIINTSASVDHDCTVADFVHISVGAHLAGAVAVGEGSWLGAGSVVSNNISICGACMIGAGAVVIRNIEQPGTYYGVPAHKSL